MHTRCRLVSDEAKKFVNFAWSAELTKKEVLAILKPPDKTESKSWQVGRWLSHLACCTHAFRVSVLGPISRRSIFADAPAAGRNFAEKEGWCYLVLSVLQISRAGLVVLVSRPSVYSISGAVVPVVEGTVVDPIASCRRVM